MMGEGNLLLEWILTICFFNLGLALLLAFVRLAKGPTLPDRVVALDLIAVLASAMIGAYSVAVKQDAYLDVAITISLIAFLGTVAFARFIQRAEAQKRGESHDN